MNQQLGYVEMQGVTLVTLSIAVLCPIETLSPVFCFHVPSVVLAALLFWAGFIHLHSRLKTFWCLLLINQCRWSFSVFEAVEMSLCPCCLCLRVCIAAFLFLLCWLRGWGVWGVASSIYWGWTTSKWVSLVCCYKLFVPEFCWSPLFFFPTPPEALPGSGASDITGGKQ